MQNVVVEKNMRKQILIQPETVIEKIDMCSKPCNMLCALQSGCPVFYVDEHENIIMKKER